MPLPIPVDPDWGAPVGGLLAQARSLPAGWRRGVAFLDTSCLSPVTMGECPTGDQLKPGQGTESTEFRPVSLIQAVECSTMGGVDVSALSGEALDSTRNYALSHELLTAEASRRDASGGRPGNPALTDAVDLGDSYATVADALACLETNILTTNSDRGAVIFVGPTLLTKLKGSLWRDGQRWRTAMGSLVIASSAFDGRAPGSDSAPEAGDPLYLYGTTTVWAAVGERASFEDVNRANNTATSRTEDLALVAFAPCALYAAASPAAVACEVVSPPEPVDPPIITSITPNSGPLEGGYDIRVAVTNLTNPFTISIDGVDLEWAMTSPGVIIVTVPPGTEPGPVDVTVTTEAGSDTEPFTYEGGPGIEITSVTPNEGVRGTIVTITGTGFGELAPGISVTFGDWPALGIEEWSDTEISGVIVGQAPATPGAVDVTVNAEGGSATLEDGFTYTHVLPEIISVDPTSGPVTGGNEVTLTGTNLKDATLVRMTGNPNTAHTIVSNTDTEVVVTMAPRFAGTTGFRIETPGGFDELTGVYVYEPESPEITAIDPDSGIVTGGTDITITGSGFLEGN